MSEFIFVLASTKIIGLLCPSVVTAAKTMTDCVMKLTFEDHFMVYRNSGEITREDAIIPSIHSCLHRKNFFIEKDDRWMVMELMIGGWSWN